MRKSAGSVRDVSHSFAASAVLPDGRSPSDAELADSAAVGGIAKRLSASTSHLGARAGQKSTKRPTESVDSKQATDAEGIGKNVSKCHTVDISSLVVYIIVLCALSQRKCSQWDLPFVSVHKGIY